MSENVPTIPEVLEKEIATAFEDEQVSKSRSFATLVDIMEKQDEMLADPSFDPKQFLGEFRDKIDNCWQFIEFAKERRETFKKIAQNFQKTGTAMQNNIDRFKQYLVDTMLANNVKSYPGNLKRIDVRTKGKPQFIVTATANSKFHFKYPELCKVEVIKRYYWDIDAVEAAMRADELDDEITTDFKKPKPFVVFENNGNPKLAKGAKVTKKKASKKPSKGSQPIKINSQDNPEYFIDASEAHTLKNGVSK